MNRPVWSNLVQTIFLSVIIGGAAGVLTSAVTNNYLSEYSLQLAALTEPLRLSQERPRNFPQSFAEAAVEVKAKAQPGVVEFYLKKTGRVSFDAVGDPAMSGLVMTSDGWLVTYPALGVSLNSTHIVIGNESYQAQKIVSDPATGAVFVKIDGQNLPVVAFGDGFAVEPTEQVFILPGRASILSARIMQITHGSDLQRESDQPERRLELDLDSNLKIYGAPAANLAGEFIGLTVVNQKNKIEIIPSNLILPAFTSLLHQARIDRASLGVKYVDLSAAVGLADDLRRHYDHGALLWDNFYAPVPYGSAAALAGLKVNDIILSIDGRPLNNQRTLAELILDYQPDDVVSLQIDRAGEVQEILVTLQSQR